MSTARALVQDESRHRGVPAPAVAIRDVDAERLDEALQQGMEGVAARVLASRGLPLGAAISDFVSPRLLHIEPPDSLVDMEAAASRLVAAITCDETVGIVSDYDVDGLCGHAAVVEILRSHFGVPPERVRSFVGHRLSDGYGVTASVAEGILAGNPVPDLLITIDNGTGDEERIAELAKEMDVIVTDHHALPDGGPPGSAFAVINPKRDDSAFPDESIAGGFVAWMLMWATRRELMEIGYLAADARSIATTLDLIACSVVADCVDMRSLNNRAAVRAGLSVIDKCSRPCWQAIRPFLGEGPVTAASIAFGIGPRINARSRVSSPMLALEFLLSESETAAESLAASLDAASAERKALEREMRERALVSAAPQYDAGRCCIVVYQENGHAGVQGVVASRLTERFGCPSLMLCPKPSDPSCVTGSARSVDGVDIHRALVEAAAEVPGVVVALGGHPAAAGVTLIADEGAISAYGVALDQAVASQVGGIQPAPRIWSDGYLAPEQITLETADSLARLEPYGHGFPAPLFEGVFDVVTARGMGRDRTHLRLTLEAGNRRISAVWFNARERGGQFPLRAGKRSARLVYELRDNWFNRQRKIQLVIRALLKD